MYQTPSGSPDLQRSLKRDCSIMADCCRCATNWVDYGASVFRLLTIPPKLLAITGASSMRIPITIKAMPANATADSVSGWACSLGKYNMAFTAFP